jgi:hypothetical protein
MMSVKSYNQDNDTNSNNTTKVVAAQVLSAFITNEGLETVVDGGVPGVSTGNNSIAGSSFAAYGYPETPPGTRRQCQQPWQRRTSRPRATLPSVTPAPVTL